MISVRILLAVAAPLALSIASAQTDEDTTPAERDFDLPAADLGSAIGDGGLDFEDVDFQGSPLKRFAQRWPDNLVIAPIPGRSPQLGWTLTLAGGYFLESKKEDGDTSPSILGGFAMFAKNGSYAYGGGANLHL